MSFEQLLKKPVVDANIKGIMVRPPEEIRKWLASVANTHGVSVNKIVLAMIEAEYIKKKAR